MDSSFFNLEKKVPKLWKHQDDCFHMAHNKSNFAFFLEMGTGKTAIAIKLIERCGIDWLARFPRVLIVCPPVVIENWKREFVLHSHINMSLIQTLHGAGKKRVKTFSETSHWKRIFITNYESLLMGDLFQLFMAWNADILVFDESHKCKDIKAKRTKQAVKLAERAPIRYILTGTPVLNSPMDVFSQFQVLDSGETFGNNFYVFRARYFYDRNVHMPRHKYFPDWKIKEGSLEEINQLIYRKAVRIKKSDCLDLPPLVREIIHVEMEKDQKRLYDEMKKFLVTYLDDTACVAQLAITKALRLQQIVSGYIKMEGGEIRDLTNNPRQKALKELLSDLTGDNKVLVWAVFHQNYIQIRETCKELGIKYVECHGLMNTKEKDESITSFNNDALVKVFIGHPRSGGIGINLAVASYSIWYSRNFSLEDDLQAESRNHRGGSEIHSKITRIDLVCPGTIDEIVLEALVRKETVSEKTLQQLKG